LVEWRKEKQKTGKEGIQMTKPILEQGKSYVEKMLHENHLCHLNVTIRGNNIVVYSEHEKQKENRCRFTQVQASSYIMNMSNHKGKWETTPFEGSLEELLQMVIEQFPWVLTDYAMDR
jgi:hypothetical protein